MMMMMMMMIIIIIIICNLASIVEIFGISIFFGILLPSVAVFLEKRRFVLFLAFIHSSAATVHIFRRGSGDCFNNF